MYNGYKIIALCISKASDERNFEFIEALNKAATERGFRIFVYHTCSDLYWKMRSEEGEKAVFDLIDYDVADAVVIFDEAFQDKTPVDRVAQTALARGVPVVSVGAFRKGCASFLFGYEKGFEQVVRHVIEYHGAKDTCFIAGKKGEVCSDQRIDVYKRVLADNGIPFREDRLFYGDYWWGPTQTAVGQIIASGELPQAILCANDSMAITVCGELKKNGYAVPEDVLVTGFDGTLNAVNHIPPITTCKCSFSSAVEDILNTVDRMIENGACNEMHDISFDIRIYRSCGCDCAPAPFNMADRLKNAEDRFYKYQDDERTLHEISEMIIASDSPRAVSEHLGSFAFFNTCIVLNSDYFDITQNPAQNTRTSSFDDEMRVMFISDADPARFPEPFCRKDILPDIDYFIRQKNPLVFSSLSFLGIPMGFICFGFEVRMEQYCRILQYVTALNTTIGNYRLMRYLRFTAESVEKMSGQDFMTGLYNRKGFYKALPKLVGCADEKDKILVATVDVDGLKNINDTFGHEVGDFAIMAVAEAVGSVPFACKICGRFGGDEFVVCAVAENDDAQQQLLDSVERYLNGVNRTSGKPLKISASVGVLVSQARGFDFEYALKQSDDRMYLVKQSRPNRRKD